MSLFTDEVSEGLRASLEEVLEMDAACQDPSCAGHCGFGHLDGCAAIREYLAEHGGEAFKGKVSSVRASLAAERDAARARLVEVLRELQAERLKVLESHFAIKAVLEDLGVQRLRYTFAWNADARLRDETLRRCFLALGEVTP